MVDIFYDFPIEIHFRAIYNILSQGWPGKDRQDDISGWQYIFFGLGKDPFYDFSDQIWGSYYIKSSVSMEHFRERLSRRVDSALENNRVEANMLVEMLLEEGWWDVPGVLFVSKWRREMTLWYLNMYKELRETDGK